MFDPDDNDFDLDDVLINDFSDFERKSAFENNNCDLTSKKDVDPKYCSRLGTLSDSSFQLPIPKHTEKIAEPSISNSSCIRARRRKFPGPAGILPERKNISFVADNDESNDECDPSMLEVSSQGVASQSVLNDEPWQRLVADLDSHPPQVQQFLSSWTVAAVKRKASARMLPGHKVPYLAAILHSVQCSSPDPFLTLRDSTGEISGTLHRDVWQQFGDDIIVGSVLVLINVGLLSVGTAPRRHYLNITENNLASIYSARHGDVRLTTFKCMTSADFIKTIDDWQKNKMQSPQPSAPCSNRSPLFTFPSNNSSPAPQPPSLFSSSCRNTSTPVRSKPSNFRNRDAITNLVCGRSDSGGTSIPFNKPGQSKENNSGNNRTVPKFLSGKLANKFGASGEKSAANSSIHNSNDNTNLSRSSHQNSAGSKLQFLFQPKGFQSSASPSPIPTTSSRNNHHQSNNCQNDLRSVNGFEPNNRTVVRNGEKRLIIDSNCMKDVQSCDRSKSLSNTGINLSSSSSVYSLDLDSEFEKSQVEDVLDGLDAESLFGDFD
ncbi:uncharacterized protein LOC111051853 [Nilaparvata lugens]|uniref:uncharacterized protein LOC111051853 n=1 Tax=Nilaparvata lugens TaxID=108931 RepID=UPI00193E9DED|nr:uncharacterized protein LOC111051853 [Nilaparvata lugens]